MISSIWQNWKSLVYKEAKEASGQETNDVLVIENEKYFCCSIIVENSKLYFREECSSGKNSE